MFKLYLFQMIKLKITLIQISNYSQKIKIITTKMKYSPEGFTSVKEYPSVVKLLISENLSIPSYVPTQDNQGSLSLLKIKTVSI